MAPIFASTCLCLCVADDLYLIGHLISSGWSRPIFCPVCLGVSASVSVSIGRVGVFFSCCCWKCFYGPGANSVVNHRERWAGNARGRRQRHLCSAAPTTDGMAPHRLIFFPYIFFSVGALGPVPTIFDPPFCLLLVDSGRHSFHISLGLSRRGSRRRGGGALTVNY